MRLRMRRLVGRANDTCSISLDTTERGVDLIDVACILLLAGICKLAV